MGGDDFSGWSTLPSSIDVRFANGDSVEVLLKYLWKPLKCLKRRVLGHDENHCLRKDNVHKQELARVVKTKEVTE